MSGSVSRYPCDCTHHSGVCWIVRHPRLPIPVSYGDFEEANDKLKELNVVTLKDVLDVLVDLKYHTVPYEAAERIMTESQAANKQDPRSPIVTWYDAGSDWCRLTLGEPGIVYTPLTLKRLE